jgi:hypothetical protein
MHVLRKMVCLSLLGGLVVVAAAAATRGDQVWVVSLDTSQLAADYFGPFGIDFELIGSSGNTVTLSNFAFGNNGGPGPGPAFLSGGASGDLGSTVSLNDGGGNFFSDFNQQFTPDTSLTFTMDSTLAAPSAGGTRDNFSMVIFTGYDPFNGYSPIFGSGGTPIETTDPYGNDTFFNFDIDGSASPTVYSYPSAAGDMTVTVTPVGVPEPSSGLGMLIGALVCLGARVWRRARREPDLNSGLDR